MRAAMNGLKLLLVVACLIACRAEADDVSTAASARAKAQLSNSLIAWVSSQCELIIDEMEAIAKHNSESSSFSVVSYLRFLNLFDSLSLLSKQNIDELKWVKLKAQVYERNGVYKAAMDVVTNYLESQDAMLTKIELKEDQNKSRQGGATDEWKTLYETIMYIATHAPKSSKLEEMAVQMLKSSPNNTADKVRSTRYQLKTQALHR